MRVTTFMPIIFDFGCFLESYSERLCPIFDSSPIFSFFKISVFPLSTLISRQNWKMIQLNSPEKVRFPEIDQIEKCYVDCSWVSNKSLWRKFFVQFQKFFFGFKGKRFWKANEIFFQMTFVEKKCRNKLRYFKKDIF